MHGSPFRGMTESQKELTLCAGDMGARCFPVEHASTAALAICGLGEG